MKEEETPSTLQALKGTKKILGKTSDIVESKFGSDVSRIQHSKEMFEALQRGASEEELTAREGIHKLQMRGRLLSLLRKLLEE